MNWKKLLLYGAIAYGVYYILKKRGILLGQISRLPERRQYWPQRTTYKPGIPE